MIKSKKANLPLPAIDGIDNEFVFHVIAEAALSIQLESCSCVSLAAMFAATAAAAASFSSSSVSACNVGQHCVFVVHCAALKKIGLVNDLCC